MPTSQLLIDSRTPMGANLVADGATFRVWAPAATALYVITDELTAARTPGWAPKEKDLLVRHADETWTGFVAGIGECAPYRFRVVGELLVAHAGATHVWSAWAQTTCPPCARFVRL